MKKIKFLILLFFLFCLSGCGYDDFYENYSKQIDNLNYCLYETKDVHSNYSFENYKMRITMDSKAMYINGFVAYKGNKASAISNSYGPDISINMNSFKESLTAFGESGECPANLYLNVINNQYAELRGTNPGGIVYNYKLTDDSYKNENIDIPNEEASNDTAPSSKDNNNSTTVNNDSNNLRCEYGIVDAKTNTVTEAVYVFILNLWNQDAESYDYEFKDVYNNSVGTTLAPNYKDDLIRYGILDADTNAMTCPELAVNSAEGLILKEDAKDQDVILRLVDYSCGFPTCNFSNLEIVGSDNDPYTCNYDNGNNEHITIEGKGNQCTITYPDGTKEDVTNGICGQIGTNTCGDFYYNKETKETKMASEDYTSWYNEDHNNYDQTLHEFICDEYGNSLTDYYCSGDCEWQNNRNIDCNKINKKINGNTGMSTTDLCRSDNLKVPLKYIGWLLTAAKIIIPVLVIIFGIVDFFKVITSGKPEEITKAIKSILMRVIAGVVIFFIPAIINFLFTLLDDFNDYKTSYSECTKCLSDPKSC